MRVAFEKAIDNYDADVKWRKLPKGKICIKPRDDHFVFHQIIDFDDINISFKKVYTTVE